MDLSQKKILILGGNPETLQIVKVANDLGCTTIVLDPVIGSPAKSAAAISVDVDALDVDAVCDAATQLGVDGILVGVADTLVSTYFEVCRRLNLPCYVTEKSKHAFSSKRNFQISCKDFNIPTIPEFSEEDVLEQRISEKIDFPILIKPDDNGGGVGITVCNDFASVKLAMSKAKSFSKSGNILIEKFMNARDMFAYYEVCEGQVYLVATADRYKTDKNTVGSPVSIGAIYPSEFESDFLSSVHLDIVEMLKGLDIERGIFCVQFFKNDRGFFAYDPGFRFQGEGMHFHLLHAFGLDQRRGMIEYALGKSVPDYSQLLPSVRVGQSNCAVTVWILLNPGKISSVRGAKALTSLESYQSHVQRFKIGDCVTTDMIGTEKQVFARVYLQHPSPEVIARDVDFINQNLKVLDGESNMIVDMLSVDHIKRRYRQ